MRVCLIGEVVMELIFFIFYCGDVLYIICKDLKYVCLLDRERDREDEYENDG